jgi:hypothetical protein
MRVVLHIGMPKSGTTAIQNTLFANRKMLKSDGVLYPAGGGLPKKHNILVRGVARYEKLPRLFRQVYRTKPERMLPDFEGVVSASASAARDPRVHTVILSSEMLFRYLSQAQAEILNRSLRSFADRIDVVAYIRHPAAYYVSMVQQTIKASALIQAPVSVNYRAALESYATIADSLTVTPYDRPALRGGDITRDLLHRTLPEQEALAERLVSRVSNETLSAEGMDIVQRYRRHAHPDGDQTFTVETALVLRQLMDLDREVAGFARPRPRPEVHEALVRSAVDLPWLLDAHGIRFPDVDYGAEVGRPLDRPRPTEINEIDEINEVCHVDFDRRDKLTMLLMQRLTSLEPKETVRFSAALPV